VVSVTYYECTDLFPGRTAPIKECEASVKGGVGGGEESRQPTAFKSGRDGLP